MRCLQRPASLDRTSTASSTRPYLAIRCILGPLHVRPRAAGRPYRSIRPEDASPICPLPFLCKKGSPRFGSILVHADSPSDALQSATAQGVFSADPPLERPHGGTPLLLPIVDGAFLAARGGGACTATRTCSRSRPPSSRITRRFTSCGNGPAVLRPLLLAGCDSDEDPSDPSPVVPSRPTPAPAPTPTPAPSSPYAGNWVYRTRLTAVDNNCGHTPADIGMKEGPFAVTIASDGTFTPPGGSQGRSIPAATFRSRSHRPAASASAARVPEAASTPTIAMARPCKRAT